MVGRGVEGGGGRGRGAVGGVRSELVDGSGVDAGLYLDQMDGMDV